MADSLLEIDNFMAAIRRLESGSYAGNYDAVGPWTGYLGEGLGAYQIMSENWPHWAREAGIPGADWRSKEAQDHVAKFKFTQYWNTYENWSLVAIAWFGGPGAANKARDAGYASVGNRTDVLGTSIDDYVTWIRNYMVRAPQGYQVPQHLLDLEQQMRLMQTAPDPFHTEQPNPYYDLVQYLTAIETDPESTPSTNPMRQPLTTMLDTISNAIAGGRRAPIEEALQVVSERSEDLLEASRLNPLVAEALTGESNAPES